MLHYHSHFTILQSTNWKLSVPGPTITFGFIISTLLGAGFHFVLGGDARRLASFLLAGWIAFVLGHVLGASFDLKLLNVGALRLMPAILVEIVALVFTRAVTANRFNRHSVR